MKMDLNYPIYYFNYFEFFQDLAYPHPNFIFDNDSYYQNSFKFSANSYGYYDPHAFYNNIEYHDHLWNESQSGSTHWEDDLDPDSMTYEELLELGETVGTESRGLSKELIALLPVSKYKRHFFMRKKSRTERCVICQMEYKRGEQRVTLPCKHKYHAVCGASWLAINKACPICYVHVFADIDKR